MCPRRYLKLHALPASDARILLIANSGANVGVLMLRSTGALQLRNNSTPVGADSTALSVGTLYRVALRQKKGTGSDAILEAYLATGDAAFGSPFASTSAGTWTTQATNLRLGATAAVAVNATVDNIRLDSGSLPPAGYAPHGKSGLHRDIYSEPSVRPKWGSKPAGWGGKRPPTAPVLYTSPPTGQIWKVYYYAGAQMIAMRELSGTTGNALYYLHGDHLGSTSTTTCGNSACGTVGAVLTRQSYYPYGGVRVAGNLPTDHTFTGQIEDDSTGLYFYNARYYSGSLGRFISADTIVPGAGNPQAFNRYSYVLNSPLNYIDPTGHVYDDWADCDHSNSSGTYDTSNGAMSQADCWKYNEEKNLLENAGVTGDVLSEANRDIAGLLAALTRGFGMRFAGKWAWGEVRVATQGIVQTARAFGRSLGDYNKGADAFKAVYTSGLAPATMRVVKNACPGSLACVLPNNEIWISTKTFSRDNAVNIVIHELGHMFDFKASYPTLTDKRRP